MYNVIKLDCIDSTSTYIKEHNLKDVIVVANRQTNGRGRTGNAFLSPEGGLYFSFTYPFKSNNDLITLKVGLAVSKALKEYNIQTKLKWVNDIYYESKKLGGILCEKYNDCLIIGVGVNINNDVSEIGDIATSISIDRFDNIAFIKKVIEHIDYYVSIDNIKEEYERNLILINVDVDYTYNNQDFTGKVLGINQNGELLIKSCDKVIALNSGVVTIHKGGIIK